MVFTVTLNDRELGCREPLSYRLAGFDLPPDTETVFVASTLKEPFAKPIRFNYEVALERDPATNQLIYDFEYRASQNPGTVTLEFSYVNRNGVRETATTSFETTTETTVECGIREDNIILTPSGPIVTGSKVCITAIDPFGGGADGSYRVTINDIQGNRIENLVPYVDRSDLASDARNIVIGGFNARFAPGRYFILVEESTADRAEIQAAYEAREEFERLNPVNEPLVEGEIRPDNVYFPGAEQSGTIGSVIIDVVANPALSGLVAGIYPRRPIDNCLPPYNVVASGITDPVAGGVFTAYVGGEVAGSYTTPGPLVPDQFTFFELSTTQAVPPNSVTVTYRRSDGVELRTSASNIQNCLPDGQNCATGGDPHIVCLDNTRLDVYEAGIYRLFDNLQTDASLPMVLNAEIVRDPRNHEDLYSRVAVMVGSEKLELRFTPEGIVENRATEPSATWERRYTHPNGAVYTLTCEAAHHTIGLKVENDVHKQKYCGLLTGQIVPVAQMSARHKVAVPTLRETYRHNALLCGSVRPHVITTNKQVLKPRNGTFRYLQWDGGCVNVTVDAEGLVYAAALHQDGQKSIAWNWASPSHWQMNCFQDWVPMATHQIYEKELTEDILFRLQPNGAISCALRRLTPEVAGLVRGDVLEVELSNTEPIAFASAPAIEDTVRGTSLYERLIAPVV